MRAGELLELKWGDINWRGRTIHMQRNVVRGQLTTPKSHQQRRVDLSRQLAVTLRLWRRRQRTAWLAVAGSQPDWVFASVTGTPLDESNVRKAFNRLLDARNSIAGRRTNCATLSLRCCFRAALPFRT
jgi:integrase